MSETPKTGTPPEARISAEIEAYSRIWRETLASVLGQITGKPLTLELQPSEAAEKEAAEKESAKKDAAEKAEPGNAKTGGGTWSPDVYLNITLAGALRGEQVLGLSTAHARWLAASFTGEPTGESGQAGASAPVALTSDQSEAVEELFRQVAGRAASDLKPSWGEVQIHVKAGGAPSWPAASTFQFLSPAGTEPELRLELRLSAALTAALRKPEAQASTSSPVSAPGAEKAGPTGGATPPGSGPASPSSTSPSLASPGTVNLDDLKNVPLDLTLRFGQRRMKLREILELGPGSVIELDRRLKEPVDLLLDGQVLARGEVVVIQGCYGLRVTQIAAREGAER